MPRRQDDDVAWRTGGGSGRGPVGRSLALAAGLVLAVAATSAAFVTDDARYLRLAVLAAVWAFVAAALVAGRFRSDQHAAAGREQELRRAYERELEHEAAARRVFEADLESDLRRQAEEALRRDLAVLRREIAELARVRDELAQIGELRTGLTALRDGVAALSGLRGDVAALGASRDDRDQLGELRAELGRLRAELAAQGSFRNHVPALPSPDPDPVGTPLEWPTDRAIPDPEELPVSARSRHATAGPSLAPLPPVPTTAETAAGPPRPVPYRRRRTDDAGRQRVADPAEALTTEHRFAATARPAAPPSGNGQSCRPATDGHVRVAEILAENGVSPSGTPRRRRRYREDDDPDDVLARVLGNAR